MNWLTSIFSTGASALVDSVGKAIDNITTSDEERLMLRNKLASAIKRFELDVEKESLKYEKEITKRWTSDNEHSITRLVRPLSYIFVLVLFAVMVIVDGNIGLTIKDAYIPVIETLLATMTIAYFGSRGIEKTVKHFKGEK